jgi:hypothetical protein
VSENNDRTTLVETSGLTKRYGSKITAVDDLDLIAHISHPSTQK